MTKALLACELYHKIGHPKMRPFLNHIQQKQINHCPVTPGDVKWAEYIFGPNVSALKGHVTRQTPEHVPTARIKPVPSHILSFHREVTLCVDIFHMQSIPFLHTISQDIHFRTVEEIPNRKSKTLLDAINWVINLCIKRLFMVMQIHTDG